MVTTTYYYADPTQPTRPTSSVNSPEWLEVDRALLLGLEEYERTLCPGCGQPQHLAWHAHTAGEWDGNRFVCHACTAKDGQEVIYGAASLFMKVDRVALMPAFDLEKTTTSPTTKPSGGESP